MTAFILGLLTVILVLNSIFLILLVLVQLPKKETGVGMAFGGGATETLFGSGSGTVLTRATKYSAGLFMGLSLFLAIMNSAMARKAGTALDDELQRLATPTPVAPAAAAPAVPQTAPPLELPVAPLLDSNAPVPLLLSPTDAPVPTAPSAAPASEPQPAEPAAQPAEPAGGGEPQ